MRDDLNSPTQIIPFSLLANYGFINLSCCEIIVLAHYRPNKAFIVTKIQVGFRTIIRYKHLTMLEWTHGSGVNIDVGIKLEQGNVQSPGFKHASQGSRSDTLAQ